MYNDKINIQLFFKHTSTHLFYQYLFIIHKEIHIK